VSEKLARAHAGFILRVELAVEHSINFFWYSRFF
jgi:hypothetical protein